jgi:hypothetical protein
VRELDEVTALCAEAGLAREAVVEMPANNLSVVFRRAPSLRAAPRAPPSV